MGASTYTRNNVLNAALRGTTYPLPTATYVSLHDADPGLVGDNEIDTADWPGYVRRHAEQGAAIGTGWSKSTAGETKNAKQLTYPSNDGAGQVTFSHVGVWDALSGGNFLGGGELTTPITLEIGDVHVFDINTVTITHT
jgi:hypothetical protein